MITKDEIQELLHSTETYRVERTTSTGDMDKFQEAICAFANDLPNSRKNGGLYGNARPKNFPSVNDYRNPLVASAMKTLGYVNMFNRGVGQVQADLKENGNQPAEFNVNLITAFKVDVKVSQSYTNENDDKTGGKVGGDIVENVVGKDLNDVEKPSDVVENVVENKENVVENILASISKNSTLSTKKLAAMCSLSERQVQRIMTKLKEQGVIRRIAPDKGGHWEIIAP